CLPRSPLSTLFPYTTLFRSDVLDCHDQRLLSDVVERGAVLAGLDGDHELRERLGERVDLVVVGAVRERGCLFDQPADPRGPGGQDRKSTRLNSSHVKISYAV